LVTTIECNCCCVALALRKNHVCKLVTCQARGNSVARDWGKEILAFPDVSPSILLRIT
jgi:hypothetical protein